MQDAVGARVEEKDWLRSVFSSRVYTSYARLPGNKGRRGEEGAGRASGFRGSVEKYGEEGTAGRKHGTFPRNGRTGRVEADERARRPREKLSERERRVNRRPRERRLCGSTPMEEESVENGLERREECDLGEVEGKRGTVLA